MSNLSVSLRPADLESFIGNSRVVAALQKQLSERVPVAFLFSGASGCGKTTLAKIVVQMVDGEVTELNAADTNGVDAAREWIQYAQSFPLTGKSRKVFILNEIHKLTPPAQEALLPPLESETGRVLWIGTSTEPEKLVRPVRKRFIEYELKPLTKEEIAELIGRACEASGSQDFHQRDNFIDYAVKCRVGSPRDILMGYEKLISGVPQTEVFTEDAANPLFRDIALSVIDGNWDKVRTALEQVKTTDTRGLRAVVSAFLRSALIKAPFGSRADAISACLVGMGSGAFEDGVAYSSAVGLLYRCCQKIAGK